MLPTPIVCTPPTHFCWGGGWASDQFLKKRGLNMISIVRRGVAGKEEGCSFYIKKDAERYQPSWKLPPTSPLPNGATPPPCSICLAIMEALKSTQFYKGSKLFKQVWSTAYLNKNEMQITGRSVIWLLCNIPTLLQSLLFPFKAYSVST